MNVSKRKHSEVESDDDDEMAKADLSDEEGGMRVQGIYIPPPPKPTCSNQSEGPRLMITKIENHFFKSYANKEILGPFHQCFNSIVGPNGSGKSNVIDSMLFVFGYRASKIRSKKLSVLLHNSEKYKNVQSCTVTVHFAMITDRVDGGFDFVSGSEFTISRTAHKDNSSYYLLNDRKVQFKEVAQLLRSHGVDLDHNRFLILQGEVEQIALMKCKASNEHETGMLEYLEDIIGTTRYKVPLKQLEERVEILGEQRSEKLNRVKLIEKELDDLRAPMKEAVGFLKTENKIIAHKNFLYQKNLYDLNKNVESVQGQRKEVEVTLAEFAEKLGSLKEEIKTKNSELKEKNKKYENLRNKNDQLKEAYHNACNRDEQLHADMTHINTNRKKTKELLNAERKKLANLENLPEENEKNIEEYSTMEEKLLAEKEALEAKKAELLPTLRNETQELQERKEVLAYKLGELKTDVGKTKTTLTMAESELKLYLNNEETEKNKLENLQTTYQTVVDTIKERTEAVASLKKKIPATEKSLQEALADLQKNRQEESKILNIIREKRAVLEETRASMQASHSRNRVLDALMQQKREGNCNGLFGRLGDLGAIDKKYDIAVSTACGPLDYIVVDTVATGQWCIEFLKKHDIGRQTFIALEKQEHLREQANSTIKTPENVPRLFDLIRISDERVKTAFYYALRDTLVANDLEQATRIAYGAHRYRVVTLRGDLIETTGTMSGGGKTVSKGRMGQSIATTNVRPEELQAIEADLGRNEEKLRSFHQKQKALDDQVNTLQPELHRMKTDFEKFSMELKSLRQSEVQLGEKIKVQKVAVKNCRSDAAKVKQLEAAVAARRAEFEEASLKANEVQIKVDEITKEIKDKTSGKMRLIEKNISDVVKKIDKCKKEINRMKIASKTAVRNAKLSTEAIARMEQEIVDAEEKLRSMQKERTEIEVDGKQLLKCIEDIAEKLTESEGNFAGIKEEVQQLMKKENKLKSDKIEIDEKSKSVNKKVNEIQSNIHHVKSKLSKLQLHEIPEENIEPLRTFTEEELVQQKSENIQRELQYAEEQLKASKPNLNAIQEYRKQQDIYMGRSKELDEISRQKTEMKNVYDTVKNKRKQEFINGYNIIKMKLKEMYQMITLGGDADFEMVDTYDPFTEGIQFNVRPPKKSWKNISNLSGGEKTLSSLALVFALHYYKPSPLYVMDEIDAALDFKNVSIVGNYIKERTRNAQFIIISLRSNMFELSNRLIGIYKTYNCTKSLAVDPTVFENNDVNQINGEGNDSDKENNDSNVSRIVEENNQRPDEVVTENNVQNDSSFEVSAVNDVQEMIVEDSLQNGSELN